MYAWLLCGSNNWKTAVSANVAGHNPLHPCLMMDGVAVISTVDLLVFLEDTLRVAGAHEVVVGGATLLTTPNGCAQLAAVVAFLQHVSVCALFRMLYSQVNISLPSNSINVHNYLGSENMWHSNLQLALWYLSPRSLLFSWSTVAVVHLQFPADTSQITNSLFNNWSFLYIHN